MASRIRLACDAVAAPDRASARLSRLRQLVMARPVDSLGELDRVVHQIAAIRGAPEPASPLPAVVSVLAGDHGVAVHGTSTFRHGLTSSVLDLIVAGQAPISILAAQAGARVAAADFGLVQPVGDQRFKIGPGTDDISVTDAMPLALASRAITAGLDYAAERLADAELIAVGEIGVGNTTAASAVAARLLGISAAAVVGSGSGIGDAALARKRELVERALIRARNNSEARAGSEGTGSGAGDGSDDPVAVLAALGGFEIAGNVGVILAAAQFRRVIVLDGFISGVAALAAVRLCPAARDYLVAAHCSAEPGHRVVLAALGLRPLLDLELRLGMASGAALALGLINSALAVSAQTPRASDTGLVGAAGAA